MSEEEHELREVNFEAIIASLALLRTWKVVLGKESSNAELVADLGNFEIVLLKLWANYQPLQDEIKNLHGRLVALNGFYGLV